MPRAPDGCCGGGRYTCPYIVLPGLRRDALLARPQIVASAAAELPAWWRPAEVT